MGMSCPESLDNESDGRWKMYPNVMMSHFYLNQTPYPARFHCQVTITKCEQVTCKPSNDSGSQGL